ncbi:sugar-binding domain-containing protein [Paenibacillus chartarius]|uniref:Beta-mannosidase B n=1 Tax=Paenibacillus chartarius TaxID=747481 RepID=A0ABV6DLC1_9BACL
MELNGLWRIHHVEAGEKRPLELAAPGLDDRFWMTAKVPGDIHSALVERKVIDNPYFGHNDLKSRWIEDKEWWYRTQFEYRLGDKEEKHELIFEGLDTFATVFVNGLEIGTTSNALMGHTFDVTRIVKNGKNTIAVKLDPLRLHNRDKEQLQWSSYTKERPWVRKAAMNFGWDWGPRIVTVGIWGGVRLVRYRYAKLDSVYARTVEQAAEQATVRVDIEVKRYERKRATACEVRLVAPGGEQAASARIPVGAGGAAVASADLMVTEPKLWWTHDLGQPELYRLIVELLSDEEVVDRFEQDFGIRTIELQLEDEQGRPAFAFVLNGVKLFAKGANWIPVDNMIGAAPDRRYTDLIELSVEANMNMLRVWAGGIYEKDIFFRECDRLGVLVWQDFAFANALFPDFNRDFMENVRREVVYNVKRLRNHACLALWCGNNEIDWLYDMKTSGGDITCPFYGERIYHELIPEVLEELDDSRPYWPSSPFGGNDANDPDAGDRHNWQVWHGSVYPRKSGEAPILDYSIEGVTFKNYKKDFTLFSSEFGMHASANRYTLQRHIPAGEFYWGSAEMAYRNKDTAHQKGILLMEGYTGIPQDIEQYMKFSMLTQAEGLKFGIEHYRRNKKRTSGSLVWQLNDSWPGTSWSLIDYELLPKASYHYAKRFYHPVLLSLDYEPEQGRLAVWVVNDRIESYRGSVRLQVLDFYGNELYARSFPAEVPSNGAVQVGELSETEALAGKPADDVVVKLTAEGFEAPANTAYLCDQKDLRLPAASLKIVVNEQEQSVSVTAIGGMARMVTIDLPQGNVRFSDNFFDLMPGETAKVLVSRPCGGAVPLQGLQVTAINVK